MHLVAAFKAFFRVLSQGEAPATVAAEVPPVASPEAPRPTFAVSTDPAAQLLALLQREGRLVDFLLEDISSFSDEEVGSAARNVHGGSRRVLQQVASLRRVVPQGEGSSVELAAGFDPSHFELTGAVKLGALRGTVCHPGWYLETLKLPTVAAGADPRVIAPAQVEVKA
jgi:hypothetical protein